MTDYSTELTIVIIANIIAWGIIIALKVIYKEAK